MAIRLVNGRFPLSYMGVNAVQPSNDTQRPFDPTPQDNQNFYLMDLWLNTVSKAVWILVSQQDGLATWIKFTGTTGDVLSLSADDGNTAFPLAGNILMHNTDGNILTTAATANTVTYNFAPSIVVAQNITSTAGNINKPKTTAAFATGTINSGGSRFISDFGTNNTFMGINSGVASGSGANNTGIGATSLNDVTTGVNNTALGNDALGSVTTGQNNIGIGQVAAHSMTTGNDNTGIGAGVLALLTSGIQNVAIGSLTGNNLLTGSNNVLIGPGTGTSYAGAESGNFLVQNAGVLGESNTIRISTNATKCFIAGIAGVTTAVNDAVPVLISSSTGQLGTTSSSIRVKENIVDMNTDSSPVMDLRPVTFNFIGRSKEETSWGLIAEEVEKVMPQLVVYKEDRPETVKYHDLSVLLLNEVKKLSARLTLLERKKK